MITASFSLLQQLISMNCFPTIRMRYTSDTQQGQIYFREASYCIRLIHLSFRSDPNLFILAAAINYLLLIAVIGTVAGFGTVSLGSQAFLP